MGAAGEAEGGGGGGPSPPSHTPLALCLIRVRQFTHPAFVAERIHGASTGMCSYSEPGATDSSLVAAECAAFADEEAEVLLDLLSHAPVRQVAVLCASGVNVAGEFTPQLPRWMQRSSRFGMQRRAESVQ